MILDALQETVTKTRVDFREVGLREGFQSHGLVVPTATKIEYFERLREAGIRELNAVSFSHPTAMPQVGDAELFLRGLGPAREGAIISALVPNDRALDRAVAMAGEGLLDEIFLVFAESTAALVANGMTADHGALLEQIDRASSRAAEAGLKTSVFISTSYGCSVQGHVEPTRVVAHASELHAMRHVSELVISDSTGQADPLQVLRMLTSLSEVLPVGERLAVHFHDTRGAGLANIVAALASPFEHLVVDAAFGGWGGDFPFVPEAFGNVATEDVLEMLVGMGFGELADVAAIMDVTRDYHTLSGRPIGAKLVDARPIGWKRQPLASVV